MGTNIYHPLLLSISNETIFANSSNDYYFHLIILVAVWIVLLVTIILGTTGNLLVLYVYISRNDNKTCTFFIKMLASVDLIICLLLAPLELYQTTKGIRNEFLCKFYGFLNTHVLYSTFLITTIAFDRYFCICWPLYRIVTLNRARTIVIICGLLSSLLAIIPMSEYSTIEHVLHIHKNHSKHLSLETYDEYDPPVYTHVENIQSSALILPFTIGNITHVKCSPRFSLHLQISKFLVIYRLFHSTLFAICIMLVLILYSFIYNAVYQRRRTRTKKFSNYRKILQSYLINEETNRRSIHRDSLLTRICYYCCPNFHRNSSHPSGLHRSLDRQDRMNYFRHEQSGLMKQNPKQIVLEVNGARGKRYSAISMTSMTYCTSGVWDETSSTNMVRSRINSAAAVSYCGNEHSSASRPSTSTEDSFDQTQRLFTLNQTLSQLKPTSNSIHLTVPNQSIVVSNGPNENNQKEQLFNEIEPIGNLSQTTNTLHRSIARKSSHTLSIRQQRPSEISLQQRKVSFLATSGIAEHCIIEDPVSTNQQVETNPSPSNNPRSFSTASSLIDSNNSLTRNSVFSTRRASGFDCEAQRIFERQQREERLANIRTTLTLFIVTATFILMYLPSILIGLFNIKPHAFRELLFLLYYINSACNPLIYSFFNINFRNDIRRIYECQKREYLARRY